MKTAPLLLFLAAATVLGSEEPAQVTVTKDTAFTFYRPFKRLTKEPHYVAPLTAILCTYPSPELIEREKRATGPHFQASVHIYANPLAEDTISRKLHVFPVGAVIVKEKLAADGSASAVGGMIKRAPGFASSSGDWEYFYSEKTGGFSMGKLQNCAECQAITPGMQLK